MPCWCGRLREGKLLGTRHPGWSTLLGDGWRFECYSLVKRALVGSVSSFLLKHHLRLRRGELRRLEPQSVVEAGSMSLRMESSQYLC